MAEENQNTGAAQPQTVQLSEGVASAMAALQGLGDTNSLLEGAKKEGLAIVQNQAPATEGGEGQAAAAAEGQQNQGQATEDQAAAAEEVNEGAAAEGQQDDGVEDPFFGKITKPKKQTQLSDISLDNPEQVLGFVKSKFGIEGKDANEALTKAFTSAEKWRTEAQKLPEVQKQFDQVSKAIDALPAPLLDAMQLALQGKPWEESIRNKPSFDFSKDAEKQDTRALVNHYYPGKFEEEDFEGDPSPALEIAIDGSKTKFSVDKNTWEAQRAKIYTDAQALHQTRKASVDGSVTSLRQSFPDLTPAAEADIRGVMESGDVNTLFYNQDGSFKQEAAEMLMMAKYGKGTIKNLMKQAANQAETRANEDLLTRGADKPKPQKGNAEKPNEQVLKTIQSQTGGLIKKNTY